MSRLFLTATLALCVVSGISFADNAAADDGLCAGDPIGAFYVTKVAGAEDDGVEVGDALCYRCRYGSSPMVMVFARQNSGKVANLVKKIDAAVASNSDSRLRGLVTLVGGESTELMDSATKLAGTATPKNVPIVVAKDSQSGPANYRLNPDAEITVVVASDSQVVARHEFAADSIDIAAVMSEVDSMLN
ncbi:MAG: hypothetical protein AAF539_06270 [Planctomycetota bacterium]